jgi:predicted nucleic acid-binding protein
MMSDTSQTPMSLIVPKVYIETSVISYMTARPSNEAITLGRQQTSILFWQMQKQFDFYVSEPVVDEMSAGNPEAAQLRLAYITHLVRLRETQESTQLAQDLIKLGAVPTTSYLDAVHIALAAVHGMNHIASWNFKHIAGALARSRITQALQQLGYRHITIHTPDELIEGALP